MTYWIKKDTVQKTRKTRLLSCAAIVCCAALVPTALMGGCAVPAALDAGLAGVTPGGVQDIAESRSRILTGELPDPESITIEGFLSEHDIPLTPPENAGDIYAAVGLAWRTPFNEPAPEAEVFIRLGTTIDLAGFQRPPLNLAVVVDRSGSMRDSASATDWRSKMDAVRQALHELANQLDANDRLSIVSFNRWVTVDLPPTPGDQDETIRRAIDQLRALGDTNIYEALEMGFQQVAAAPDETRDNRVILFTDARPNVGPSGESEFLQLLRAQASLGIGFTLMGVGYDFGTELADALSRVRDANSVYLADSDRVARVFQHDFDFLVTPAAYDLDLRVTIPDGVGIRDVYGVPDYTPGSGGARMHVPTFFFSRREGGAIVVRLTFRETPNFEQEATVGHLSLSYTLADGASHRSEMDLVLPAGLSATGEPAYFSDEAVRRAAVLVDTVLALREAVDSALESRAEAAVTMLEEFLEYFDEATLGMSNTTEKSSRRLSEERDLIETLLGTLSGGWYSPYWYAP